LSLEPGTIKPNARTANAHWIFPWLKLALILISGMSLTSCLNNMRDQPRYEPLEASSFFGDGRSARPLPTGVVPRGSLEVNQVTPTPPPTQTTDLDTYPFPITMQVLQKGREQYDIYCSPCHGYDGYGRGMIVERGFSPPPSLHSEALRRAPGSHIYDVISNGFGRMYSYAYRVSPDDRWAIVAYIRALQLSQNASQDLVPPEAQNQLQKSP
jgi:mono/diheme cytochrome c family protein